MEEKMQTASLDIEALLDRFTETREMTESLCRPLMVEDFMVSVTQDTSPPKWHLAHSTWFLEHFILSKFSLLYESTNPEFGFLFNSYYKRLGTYLSKDKRGVLSRPSTDEIMEYRRSITYKVMDVVANLKDADRQDALKILEIALHHEQQHQELLLMDIKRNFFENPLKPKYQNLSIENSSIMGEPSFQNVPGGLSEFGVKMNAPFFAYDNEKDIHKRWLDSFMLSSHLVTNEEYLEFVEEGGYLNPLLWLSDGWDFKEKEKWEHPLYWVNDNKRWWTFSLSGMVPLEMSAPVVHISFYEASAYAKWKGCRLPSEFEWEAAARMEKYKIGQFLESQKFSPLPTEEDHDFFSQIHGTVWEWTQSSYEPYPRYEVFDHGLSEYNEKFMCNQKVLRGGSCITPESHYRTTYRNFYYPHMRWQYAGVRLAKDLV